MALPQVVANVFYNNGKSQVAGSSIGFSPAEGNRMFDIKSFMVQGNFDDLAKAEGALLSSSLRYLQPINRINARSFKVSKKIEDILTSFSERLSTNLNP